MKLDYKRNLRTKFNVKSRPWNEGELCVLHQAITKIATGMTVAAAARWAGTHLRFRTHEAINRKLLKATNGNQLGFKTL